MKKFYIILAVVFTTLFMIGCAPNVSPNNYGASDVGVASKVVPGVILSRRQINIDANSGAGGIAGAVAGGAAGTAVGGSPVASVVGAVGGAVVGGVIGNAADKAVNHHKGVEYIIKLDNGNIISVAQAEDLQFIPHQRVLVIYGAMTRVVADDRI